MWEKALRGPAGLPGCCQLGSTYKLPTGISHGTGRESAYQFSCHICQDHLSSMSRSMTQLRFSARDCLQFLVAPRLIIHKHCTPGLAWRVLPHPPVPAGMGTEESHKGSCPPFKIVRRPLPPTVLGCSLLAAGLLALTVFGGECTCVADLRIVSQHGNTGMEPEPARGMPPPT